MMQVPITPFRAGAQHSLCPFNHNREHTCLVCRSILTAEEQAMQSVTVQDTMSATSKVDPCTETAEKYPKYYRPLPAHWTHVDTYRVNALFPVEDASGMILHARKKLLVPGTRTGGKSMRDDIKEARDTLTRWLDGEGA